MDSTDKSAPRRLLKQGQQTPPASRPAAAFRGIAAGAAAGIRRRSRRCPCCLAARIGRRAALGNRHQSFPACVAAAAAACRAAAGSRPALLRACQCCLAVCLPEVPGGRHNGFTLLPCSCQALKMPPPPLLLPLRLQLEALLLLPHPPLLLRLLLLRRAYKAAGHLLPLLRLPLLLCLLLLCLPLLVPMLPRCQVPGGRRYTLPAAGQLCHVLLLPPLPALQLPTQVTVLPLARLLPPPWPHPPCARASILSTLALLCPRHRRSEQRLGALRRCRAPLLLPLLLARQAALALQQVQLF